LFGHSAGILKADARFDQRIIWQKAFLIAFSGPQVPRLPLSGVQMPERVPAPAPLQKTGKDHTRHDIQRN